MSKSIYDERYVELIGALKAARLEAGKTQQQVALALDRPQSFVAKVEGRERRLDVIEFLEIARCIGWNPLSLLKRTFEGMQQGQ